MRIGLEAHASAPRLRARYTSMWPMLRSEKRTSVPAAPIRRSRVSAKIQFPDCTIFPPANTVSRVAGLLPTPLASRPSTRPIPNPGTATPTSRTIPSITSTQWACTLCNMNAATWIPSGWVAMLLTAAVAVPVLTLVRPRSARGQGERFAASARARSDSGLVDVGIYRKTTHALEGRVSVAAASAAVPGGVVVAGSKPGERTLAYLAFLIRHADGQPAFQLC